MSDEIKTFAHFATTALHFGQEPEQWTGNPVVPPISLATTFKQEEPGKHAVCSSIFNVSVLLKNYKFVKYLPSF